MLVSWKFIRKSIFLFTRMIKRIQHKIVIFKLNYQINIKIKIEKPKIKSTYTKNMYVCIYIKSIYYSITASTPTGGPYDAASIAKTTSNSAFTPINSMTPHLNSLGHHPMAQRPYLYDAISFQNKNVNQNTANSFPNQLISLHQIRNYAHQPAGLMAGEHLLGVSVGAGKDKG